MQELYMMTKKSFFIGFSRKKYKIKGIEYHDLKGGYTKVKYQYPICITFASDKGNSTYYILGSCNPSKMLNQIQL